MSGHPGHRRTARAGTQAPAAFLLFALLLAVLFCLRILVSLLTPFRVLDQVSNGLILNALIIVFLFILTILCAIGEFSIRSFVASQQEPRYIIRERIRRQGAKVIASQ